MQAAPAPTELTLPDAGGRPVLPDVPQPEARARLPVALPPPLAVPPPPAPSPPAVARAATPLPRRPERAPERPALQVAAGTVVLPDAVWGALFELNAHPPLRGYAIDVSWLRPLARGHFLALRGGVTVPTVAPGNWYRQEAQVGEQGLFVDIRGTVLAAAVEYLVESPLSERWNWSARGGAGALLVLGDIATTETLPGCGGQDMPKCAHWQRVGRAPVDVFPILPALRATVGLGFRPAGALRFEVEAGVRDLGLFAGGGASLRF